MPHPSDPTCSGALPAAGDFPSLTASIDAVMLILRLSARYGPLMFRHGEAGDGLEPLCRPVGSIALGDDDIKLGDVAGCEYWIEAGALERLGQGALRLDVHEGSAAEHASPALAGRFILRRVGP